MNFSQRDKCLSAGQNKHEWTERVVRVNGLVIEIKQSRPRQILRWVTIWQPQFFSSWQENWSNLPAQMEIQKPRLSDQKILPVLAQQCSSVDHTACICDCECRHLN